MSFKSFLDEPIAFDADGVIFDFLSSFVKAAEEAAGRKLHSLSSSYSLADRYALTPKELDKAWELFNTGPYWSNLSPIDGAMEAIDRLQREGFRNIHVVTAIPEKFRANRQANFRKLGFAPVAIHCVEHTTRWAKVPPIIALKPFMFVDDRVEHLHSNPQVPLLVHIDHGDEQFPDPHGRVDAQVKSLGKWVDGFLSQPEQWAEIALANNLISSPSPAKKHSRPRSPA